MMSREEGVFKWSKTHNSPLEYTKLMLIDFAHRSSSKARPVLQLPQRQITPSSSTKYLGTIVDQNLNWKVQQAHAMEKGIKWAAQIRRLTRSTWGLTPKYTKCLYISVVIPRILYAADVWCVTSHNKGLRVSKLGPAKELDQVITIQRADTLAIIGRLRTSAMIHSMHMLISCQPC
jgi:hypothetical protein